MPKWGKSTRLNISMLAGFAVAFVSATTVSYYASEAEHHVNTTVAVAVDYSAYMGVFFLSYYILNRETYKNSKNSIRGDVIRLVTSMGIAEIVYAIIRWISHYYLLELGYDPYMASIISQLGSTVVYFMVANVAAKLTGLLKRK